MKFCARFFFATTSLLAITAVLVACGGGSQKLPPASALAYVAHPQSHSVSVINIPANQTINTIQVGNTSTGLTASYPQTVAVTPDRTRAYVPDGHASVWVIDTKTNLVTTTIPVPYNEGLTLSPDGTRAYVGAIYGVAVIDTTSNSLITTIPVTGAPNQSYADNVAVSPDNRRVFVTNLAGNNIWVIDAATNTIVDNIVTRNTGNNQITVAPDGNHAYAAGFFNGNNSGSFVDVIDLKTNTVSSSFSVGQSLPTQITVTPDGNRIFVVDDGGHFDAFDAATNMPLISIQVSTDLAAMAFTPNDSHVYLTGGTAGNVVYVLDANTYAVVSTINVHDFSAGLTIVPAS